MSRKTARGRAGHPITIEETPYNAETPGDALKSDVTPTSAFYVRNHFKAPKIDASDWRLRIAGAVRRELTLTLREIKAMKKKTLLVTLECAGNGRARMRPVPSGTSWQDGAQGTSRWTGVPLAELLKRVGLKRGACEVLFRGADSGYEGGRRLHFERSLPVREALAKNVLLAFEMNGSALPGVHGYPLRLIVPGWYGMASVKWLVEVVVLEEPFQGWFQAARYVYSDADNRTSAPVRQMRIKSVIVQPGEGARVRQGRQCVVSGLAWSGSGPIDRVEFRSDSTKWMRASLGEVMEAHAWRRWSVRWVPRRRGSHTLMSRAFDARGDAQPLAHVWNLHGYGYNSVTKVKVRVV